MDDGLNGPGSGKRVVVFDLDGTLVPGQTQRAFVRFLRREGVMSPGRHLVLTAWFVAYKAGLAKNVEAIQSYGFGMLAGRTPDELEGLVRAFFDREIRHRIYPGAIELVQRHAKEGAELMLVSNAIEPILRRAAAHLGIPHVVATRLETRDGRFTGRIDGGNVYGERKRVRVGEFLESRGWRGAESWAYCDHHSDFPLLRTVTHPVVVNPGRAASRAAKAAGYPVLRLDVPEVAGG